MGSRVVSEGVLVAKAVRDDGFREIVAVDVDDVESESTYQDLFRGFKSRGLSGVELVVSDDHEGVKAAVGRHFQGAGWQHCQVHFSCNLSEMVARDKRKELAAELRAVFAAPDKHSALRLAGEAADRWRQNHSKVAEKLVEQVTLTNEIQRRILTVLKALPDGVMYSTTDWARITGEDKRNLRAALDRLQDEGRIEKLHSGRPDKPLYRLKEE